MLGYVTDRERQKLAWERVILREEPEVLEVLADPLGELRKQAGLRHFGKESTNTSEWLSQFRNTPFAAKAVDLLRRQIQNQSTYQQLATQSDQLQQQQQPLFDQQRMVRRQDEALEMEKEMLLLELEDWLLQQQQQGAAPPQDPVADAQAMGMDPAMIQQAQAEGQVKAASDALTLHLMRKLSAGVAPSAFQRLSAFGRAAMNHGFKPNTFEGVLRSVGDAAIPMAAIGAIGGAVTKNDNEGYLSAALKGGLGGAALGAGGAAIGKGVDFHNQVKAVQGNKSYSAAASSVARKHLTSEGRKAMDADLRHYRNENRAALPPAANSGRAPEVPAANHGGGAAPAAPQNPPPNPPASPAAPTVPQNPPPHPPASPVPDLHPPPPPGAAPISGTQVPAAQTPGESGTAVTRRGTSDLSPYKVDYNRTAANSNIEVPALRSPEEVARRNAYEVANLRRAQEWLAQQKANHLLALSRPPVAAPAPTLAVTEKTVPGATLPGTSRVPAAAPAMGVPPAPKVPPTVPGAPLLEALRVPAAAPAAGVPPTQRSAGSTKFDQTVVSPGARSYAVSSTLPGSSIPVISAGGLGPATSPPVSGPIVPTLRGGFAAQEQVPRVPTSPTIPLQDNALHVPTPQEVAAGYGPLPGRPRPETIPKWVRDNLDFEPETFGNPRMPAYEIPSWLR